jgi:uncharacterized protein
MKRQLLDVNVLLALVWPRHEGHAEAHAWFARSGHRSWASNPLTQLGLLRLLTNPAVTQGAVSPASALEVLREATRHGGHVFWPLDREIPASLGSLATRLNGHQQWTDAVLLQQATDRDGVLVTFDSGLKQLAALDLSDRILLLKRS